MSKKEKVTDCIPRQKQSQHSLAVIFIIVGIAPFIVIEIKDDPVQYDLSGFGTLSDYIIIVVTDYH